MDNGQIEMLAQTLGQPLGECLVVILGAIKAITKQPGFNTEYFDAEIQALLNQSYLTELQREALAALLTQEISQQ